MYVRFKKRRLKNREEFVLDAVLVESRWIDGQARQIFVKHLGSFHDTRYKSEYVRLWFWDRADEYLQLFVPDKDERLKIERKILRKVPRPKST